MNRIPPNMRDSRDIISSANFLPNNFRLDLVLYDWIWGPTLPPGRLRDSLTVTSAA